MGNNESFIDLKTAANLTGKSYTTMRNLVSEMSSDEKSKYLDTKGKKTRISRAFLSEKYPILGNNENITNKELMSMLKSVMAENKAQLRHYRNQETVQRQNETLRLVNELLDKGFTHDSIMKMLQMKEGEIIKILNIGKE